MIQTKIRAIFKQQNDEQWEKAWNNMFPFHVKHY